MRENVWRKSSVSNNSVNCVEVMLTGDDVLVRDSKDRVAGPVLRFTHAGWRAFQRGIRQGEFDL